MVYPMMNISQVRIYLLDTGSLGGHTRAYVDITIDSLYTLKGLRVVGRRWRRIVCRLPNPAWAERALL